MQHDYVMSGIGRLSKTIYYCVKSIIFSQPINQTNIYEI